MFGWLQSLTSYFWPGNDPQSESSLVACDVCGDDKLVSVKSCGNVCMAHFDYFKCRECQRFSNVGRYEYGEFICGGHALTKGPKLRFSRSA